MDIITRKELIEKYFDFFEKKNHKIIPSSSLIPNEDNGVLFTTAGMQQLVPFLMGKEHPSGKRLCSVQKCLRTSDIDSVGDDSHLTFFEMLGNWSLGDYFKKESILWSYEFLTSKSYLNIDKEKLAFTVFEGDNEIGKDTESYESLLNCKISEKDIYFLDKSNNWWEMGTGTGPCGPDMEIFYKVNEKCDDKCDPTCNCFLEIWNNVFMEYKVNNKNYSLLEQKNVDTGMGLERALTILNNKESVYDTEVFSNIKLKLEEITNLKYEDNLKEFRIIMDHIRTSVMILSEDEKLMPSNIGAGYILRRLIRRAVRYLKILNIDFSVLEVLANIIIEDYKDIYNNLEKNKEFIIEQLLKEEKKFNNTLRDGNKMFNKIVSKLDSNVIDGSNAFKLFDTFGFPIEMTLEMAKEKGLDVDIKEFNNKFKEHQEKSRTLNTGKFKGGLEDSNEKTIAYHTTAHIMLGVLRSMFGDSVIQKGANITSERLRFDFTLDHKMSDEEKEKLTIEVNEIINSNTDVIKETMSYEKAKESGAIGIFTNKYDKEVDVYTIGSISKEICGGPHVKNTKEIGVFKIKKEESSSAGVRRLKIILE